MADEKISQLANGNPAQAGDLFPIDRSGANFSVTAASVFAVGGLKHFSRTLSAAEVLASGTPFTLVAPVSPNGVIVLASNVVARLKFNTTPYTGTNFNLVIGWALGGPNNNLNQIIALAANGFYDATVSQMWQANLSGIVTPDETDTKGQPLQFGTTQNNVYTNPAAGDSPIIIDFYYYEYIAS